MIPLNYKRITRFLLNLQSICIVIYHFCVNMATVVQSRFAGLNIEDDECALADVQKTKKNRAQNNKKAEPAKKNKNNNNKIQVNVPKKKKTKATHVTNDHQWEVWKQKDAELVHGNYESELEQALLLSTLHYQENHEQYERVKKETEDERKALELSARASNKKQKKKNIMSLGQFNEMVSDEPKSFVCEKTEEKSLPNDPEFFDRMTEEAKTVLLKEKLNETVVNRQPLSDEIINRVQFADALEKKEQEISTLRQEIADLKTELLNVKSRNSKLCKILGQGEMKDKASVLIEVEKLRLVQTELTAEVQSLHTELEKERSRHPDNYHRTRDKKKKGGSVEKDK